MTSSADAQRLDESLKMASDFRAEFENATGAAKEHAARRLYYAGTIALWDIVGAEALNLVYGEATAETDNVTGLELLAQRTWVASQVFPSDTTLDPYSLSSASSELRSMAKGDAPKALKRPPGRRGALTNAYRMAQHQLSALCWAKYLRESGATPAQSQIMVTNAFGVTWDAVSRWPSPVKKVYGTDYLERELELSAKGLSVYVGLVGRFPKSSEQVQAALTLAGKKYQAELHAR